MAERDFRTDPHFASLVEHTEAASWRDVLADTSAGRHMETMTINDALVVIDPSLEASLSRVLLLGVDKPARQDSIESIIDAYSDAGCTEFSVHLSPVARPTSLRRLLESSGFTRLDQEAVVARATGGMAPPDSYFRIRTAEPEDATLIADIMVQAGGAAPDWASLLASRVVAPERDYFIAFDGTIPYAVGGLFIDGELGWMAPIFTLPEYRNRGTQAALIAHVLRWADDAGCRWVTTYYPATNASRMRAFERLGFELVYMRPRYRWEAREGS